MDFFEHQDQARRNTTYLISLFGLAIVTMIMALYVAAIFTLQDMEAASFRFWQPGTLVLVTVGTLGTIGFGSLTKMAELRRGGVAVAEGLGGTRINPQTEDLKERQLFNVVAEMALAAGTPIPTVYLLEQETGINAFAAGYTPDDAVIGVTRGCIEQLHRAELQGVIAHEFSHILNGDMRLNLKLIGVLQGLLFIYILGRVMANDGRRAHYDRDRKDSDNKVALFGLAMMGVGLMGLMFGRMIKSAVSRQREFLADASAVQFTRNPWGIAGALRRIGGFSSGSRLQSAKAEEASHMFFGEALNPAFMTGWMATHPPLRERIRRITGLQVAAPPVSVTAEASAGLADAAVMGLQGNTGAHHGAPAQLSTPPGAAPADQTGEFMAAIGTATPQHLAKAHAFLQGLPQQLAQALGSSTGSRALVYGMLIDRQGPVRSRQLALFQRPDSPVSCQAVEQLADCLSGVDVHTYLPLLDLSVPALRTLTAEQCTDFFQQIQTLIKADGRLSLSEYVLQLILKKRLRPHFQKKLERPKAITSLNALWPDCQVLLTVLARIGHQTAEDALYAFKSGAGRLPGANQRNLPQVLPRVKLTDFGDSLQRLELAVPKLKQAIVDAAAHTVLVDNEVTPARRNS
jgi:Zn-dependent protease with chaperone function